MEQVLATGGTTLTQENNTFPTGDKKNRPALSGFIQQVLNACGISTPFSLVCRDDFPEWAIAKSDGMDILVVCEDCAESKSSIEPFRSKPVFTHGSDLYWFEEDPEKQQPSKNQLDPPPEYHAPSNVTLPEWLDSFLFETLKASYQPSKTERAFDCNLESSQDKALIYAGTYLPRSYAECYCIFDDLFHTAEIAKAFQNRTTLNILSIGSGTCGDALGILSAIDENLPNIRQVFLTGIEGNKPARDIAKKLIHQAKQHYRFEIDFRTEDYTIDSFKDYIDTTCVLHAEGTTDILLSSKMISEMVSMGKEQPSQAYSNFLASFLPLLSPATGICLLLDVATKVTEGGTWFPVLMNAQTSKTLESMPEFRIIAPAPCRELHGSCNNYCYSQKIFEVKHSQMPCDQSKVNYRIISRATGIVLPPKQPTPCVISPPTQFSQEKRAPCSSSIENTCNKDAFLINP